MKAFAVLAALLLAQATARPAFEAASVKPVRQGQRDTFTSYFLSGGRYVAAGATLKSVVLFAYVPFLTWQTVGGPDWLSSERFDIQAKADGNPSADTLRLMLQSLLADRFKLRVHTEKRESPVYFLVRARTDGRLGPQLKPGTVDCADRRRADAPPQESTPPRAIPSDECGFLVQTRNVVGVGLDFIQKGKGLTMAQIAAQLTGPAARFVFDRTGLAGTYDVEFSYAANGGGSAQSVSIFTAVQEQLGLRLEPATAPVDFLVIDGAEHPTED